MGYLGYRRIHTAQPMGHLYVQKGHGPRQPLWSGDPTLLCLWTSPFRGAWEQLQHSSPSWRSPLPTLVVSPELRITCLRGTSPASAGRHLPPRGVTSLPALAESGAPAQSLLPVMEVSHAVLRVEMVDTVFELHRAHQAHRSKRKNFIFQSVPLPPSWSLTLCK